MREAKRTQRRSGLLSGIVIAPIIGVCLMGTSAGAQGARRATISSTVMDSSGAGITAKVSVPTQHRPGRSLRTVVNGDAALLNIKTDSTGQALSTQQLGTMPVPGNNPTGWRSSPLAFEAKPATRPPSDPCWDSEKGDVAEIDQELSAKSAKWPGATGSALWFHSLTG